MKHFEILILIFGLSFSSCNHANQTKILKENQSEKSSITEKSNDKDEIQKLIRQVLKWADSEYCIDLLPAITDSKDSIYIGFDLEKHRRNLDKLRETNFFAAEFIENYNQIILTLDQKLRNKEFENWLVGDLPTFIFANDINPWCSCQDNLNWDQVEVKIISINSDKGELFWYWGNLSPGTDTSWKEFRYKFKVVKENDKWKIAYLEGFDFKESTRKDGL